MILKSITSLFQWVPGFALQDGGLLQQLSDRLLSATGPTVVTALPGGGAAGAPVLSLAYNRVSVVATDNDSVVLPLAIPGNEVIVDNDGVSTLAVFASTSNPDNSGTADKIVAQSSLISGGGAASVTQATGISTSYFCTKLGFWKAD